MVPNKKRAVSSWSFRLLQARQSGSVMDVPVGAHCCQKQADSTQAWKSSLQRERVRCARTSSQMTRPTGRLHKMVLYNLKVSYDMTRMLFWILRPVRASCRAMSAGARMFTHTLLVFFDSDTAHDCLLRQDFTEKHLPIIIFSSHQHLARTIATVATYLRPRSIV